MPLCALGDVCVTSFRSTFDSLQRRVVPGALEEDPRAPRLAHDEIWRAERVLRLAAEPVQSASADEVAPERLRLGAASGHPGTLREGDDIVPDLSPISRNQSQSVAISRNQSQSAVPVANPNRRRTRGRRARAPDETRNRRQSEAIRGHQRQSEAAGVEHLMRYAIKRTLRRAARARGAPRNQRQSEAIRDLQSQTDRECELELEERLAIRGNQRPSEIFSPKRTENASSSSRSVSPASCAESR